MNLLHWPNPTRLLYAFIFPPPTSSPYAYKCISFTHHSSCHYSCNHQPFNLLMRLRFDYFSSLGWFIMNLITCARSGSTLAHGSKCREWISKISFNFSILYYFSNIINNLVLHSRFDWIKEMFRRPNYPLTLTTNITELQVNKVKVCLNDYQFSSFSKIVQCLSRRCYLLH